MKITSVRNIPRFIRRTIYKLYYARLLGVHSGKFDITGPCIVHGGGKFHIGDGVVIRSNSRKIVELYCGPIGNLYLDDNCFLNQGVHIVCSDMVRIGKGSLLGDEVLIIDNDFHPVGGDASKPSAIILEKDVWVASRAIILKGVHIGEGAVVGAGAVVSHSIPPRSLVVGNPARIVRQW
jgi:acetyltransferase-like isoleucine patch superfamily enzyme